MEEKYLSQLYYNPESPASFGGVDSIYHAVKNDAKYQISRNKIRQWLAKQDTYTLHKPVRYRFTRNRVIVAGIDDEWEADLVIMDSLSKHNNGYKYAEENDVMKQARRSLIGSMFGEKILLATPLLKWYLEHGLEATRVYQVLYP